MARLQHGEMVSPDEVGVVDDGVASADVEWAAADAAAGELLDFDFLLPDLQRDPANLLPQSAETNNALRQLGRSMEDTGSSPGNPKDTKIPAIYTYFGQFVDHDITLEEMSFTVENLTAPGMVPLTVEAIRRDIKNRRRPTLDLDSVYGSPIPPSQLPPRDGARLVLGGHCSTGPAPGKAEPARPADRRRQRPAPRATQPEPATRSGGPHRRPPATTRTW